MSENKTNRNNPNEVRGSRTSFLIVCFIAIALAIAVVIMGAHMAGAFGGNNGSESGNSGASSAAGSSSVASSGTSSSNAASSGDSSASASSSAASSSASSAASSGNPSLPQMDEGGQDKAFSEIMPVISYISKTAQPGTMGADERITMCAVRLLDTLFSSNCSPTDFREAALSYKEESGISDDLREQLDSVIKEAKSFSDEAAAKKALSGSGITSKSPWDAKTFERLSYFAGGLGF